MTDVGQTGMSGEQSRRCLVLIQICFNVIHVYIIKQLMIFNFGEYKNWSTHGTWYSPRHSMGWSIPVFTSLKVINCILSPLSFTMNWDIDLIFGMRVYSHKLQINFEIRSCWMICGQLTALGLWNLDKYSVVTTSFHYALWYWLDFWYLELQWWVTDQV